MKMRNIGIGALIVLIGWVVTWVVWREQSVVSETEIAVGVVAPLTGDNAKYGESAKRGLELAVAEVNEADGVRGKKLRLIFEDSQGLPQKGASAIQKLIIADGAKVVIGDLLSTSTLAMAPIAERSRVVLLSPTSSSPKLTDAGDYVFRNVAADVFEGRVIGEAAWDRLGVKRVAVIRINNDYGAGLAEVFRANYVAKGGIVVAEETYPQNTSDFRTQLTKIAAAQPDGLYMVGYRELGQVLKQASDLGLETRFLSNALFEDPEILRVAGSSAEGVVFSSRAFEPESADPVTRRFVDAYRVKYNETPDLFAAYSYDAAKILVLAMKNGGFTSDEIKTALYAVKDYPGVCGLTSFDDKGDVVQPAYLRTVRNGKFAWFDPK